MGDNWETWQMAREAQFMFKVDLEKFSGLVALAHVGTCLLSGCMHVSVESWGFLSVLVSSWEAVSMYLLNVIEQKYQP